MEPLKKIVLGCRQHYEKVILTVALVALGLAVWFLYEARVEEELKIAEFFKDVERRSVKLVPPVDISRNAAALKVAASAPSLNLGGGHYLFNPVMWQRRNDGTLFKIATGREIGPDRIIPTKIRPLNLYIALDRVAASSTPNAPVSGYQMVSTNEAALPNQPRRQTQFANVNLTNRNTLFILREVKGPPEEPTELIVELRDTGERVKVIPGQPFVRTVGYEADLVYPNTGRTYNNKRKDNLILIAGENYKISDITADTVVLFDESNLKTYIRKLAAAP